MGAENGGIGLARFVLDTSGQVNLGKAGFPFHNEYVEWPDLDPFTQGYVEAMFVELYRRTDHEAEENGDPPVSPGSDRFAFYRLAPETLAAILKDCERFLALFGLCDVATPEFCGATFWGQRSDPIFCSSRVEDFPLITPYLGDDGRVYLREATK